MAFGNYYGSTLPPYQTPYYQPQPMMTQPMAETPNYQNQAPGRQTQPSPIQTSVLWVNDENEARESFVLSNNTVLIIQRDMSKLYIKSADNIGRTTLDSFEIKKTSQNADNVPKIDPQCDSKIDTSKFITRDEVLNLIPNNDDFVTRSELDEILSAKKKTSKSTKED